MIVGEVADEDCTNLDSSIFASCSWLGIDERRVVEPIVLILASEALCVCKSECAEGVAEAL